MRAWLSRRPTKSLVWACPKVIIRPWPASYWTGWGISPRRGEELRYKNLCLEITEMKRVKIERLLISFLPGPEDPSPESDRDPSGVIEAQSKKNGL